MLSHWQSKTASSDALKPPTKSFFTFDSSRSVLTSSVQSPIWCGSYGRGYTKVTKLHYQLQNEHVFTSNVPTQLPNLMTFVYGRVAQQQHGCTCTPNFYQWHPPMLLPEQWFQLSWLSSARELSDRPASSFEISDFARIAYVRYPLLAIF